MRSKLHCSVLIAVALSCLAPVQAATSAKRALLLQSFRPRFSSLNSFVYRSSTPHQWARNLPMLATAVEDRRLQASTLKANDREFLMWKACENFRRLKDGPAFEWSSRLRFTEMLLGAAALPWDAVVFCGNMVLDADGGPLKDDQVPARTPAGASVPTYARFASQIRRGGAGRSLLSGNNEMAKVANAALRIRSSEPPAEIDVPTRERGPQIFDGREHDLWEIREASPLTYSTVLFLEPTVWQKYRWPIISSIVFCVFQISFVVALREYRRRLRRQKSALDIRDDRLETTADAAGLGLWVWDIAKDHVWATECGRQLFGWKRSTSIDFERFVGAAHADDRPLFRRAVREALDGKGDFEIEHRLALPKDLSGWVTSRGHAEFGSDGKPERIRGITFDISARHQAEERARELGGRLINVYEEERSRLARELHDDISQRLAVLAIKAARGEQNAITPADGAAMRCMREELARLSEDVHSLSYRLHPSILEDLGLADALQAECDHFFELEGTPVDADISDIPEGLPSAVALCLFRVAQEALHNVGHHAAAAMVRVSVWQEQNRLCLSIKDDGTGFDTARQRVAPSLGLASMRQRVELVGGKFTIESAENFGTTVLAWVPLQGGET
ncbi:ATP-binding protein [Rhizobium leguminosarum]|uniref:histidine kinase n=1 Tax=Rhizobium leguminosarum TaxID=384 RepID=A0A2Z4YSD0_RHILE|nr:ATP-binding protein [Rhizobium leguminosarum]AXA44284.1 Histidine kinase-, DNA gyrase B-, and HSP90-like ATPase family protein [Rhizobium leguminosarum]